MHILLSATIIVVMAEVLKAEHAAQPSPSQGTLNRMAAKISKVNSSKSQATFIGTIMEAKVKTRSRKLVRNNKQMPAISENAVQPDPSQGTLNKMAAKISSVNSSKSQETFIGTTVKTRSRKLARNSQMSAGPECDDVVLSGTDYHLALEGTYVYYKYGCTYYDKMYKGPDDAVMYHTNSNGSAAWLVGPVECHPTAYLISLDTASYPVDLDNTWLEATSTGFEYNYDISVQCKEDVSDCASCMELFDTAYTHNTYLEDKYYLDYKVCTSGYKTYSGPAGAYLYHVTASGFPTWCIGTTKCSSDLANDVDILVQDDAKYPDLVTETWSEKDEEGEFEENIVMKVHCCHGTMLQPFWIISGCVALMLLVGQ